MHRITRLKDEPDFIYLVDQLRSSIEELSLLFPRIKSPESNLNLPDEVKFINFSHPTIGRIRDGLVCKFKIEKYVVSLISIINPDLLSPKDYINNPCMNFIVNENPNSGQVIKCRQTHWIHNKQYCFKDQATENFKCRFGFLKYVSLSTNLSLVKIKNDWIPKLYTERNCPHLN